MRRASRGRLERPLSVTEVAGRLVVTGMLWGCDGGGSLLPVRGFDAGRSDVMPFASAMMRDGDWYLS